MRNWTVDGADANTGQPRRIVVLAQDEGDATRKANAQGLLVSNVFIYDHAAAQAVAPAAAPPASDLESAAMERRRMSLGIGKKKGAKSEDISGAASRLRAADFVMSILGGVYIALGILGLLLFGALLVNENVRSPAALGLAAGTIGIYSITAVAAGVVMLGIGAAFRMLASIGLATKQIAKAKAER